MLKIIFAIIVIIILWCIAFDCNKKLSQNLSKPAILIFTSFFYLLIMMVYLYYNIDHCYNHLSLLNIELLVLLLLIPLITVVTSLMFAHTNIPKLI